MTLSIGFLGLGGMGRPMAECLLRAGLPLAIRSGNPETAREFAAMGAQVVPTPAALAEAAGLVFSCLPDHGVLDALVFGPDGLAAQDWPGGLLVDCSTIAPQEAQDMARRLAGRGAAFLDAPVSGGRKGAAEGTLTAMVGGAEADLARARPALGAMAARIFHIGPVGAGQTTKACNQIMVAVNLMGAFEAIGLARAGGVDVARMREVVLTGTGRSAALEAIVPRYLEGAEAVGFRLEQMLKDIAIATDAGRAAGQHQPGAEAVREMLAGAAAAGLGARDLAALGLRYDALNGDAFAED